MGAKALLHTRLFTVERVTYANPTGVEFARDIVRHPGSVVIVPVLEDGRICLIKNFRIAVDKHLLELPAGTLEASELPRDCAGRELIEETGYRAGQIELLTSFYAAPGILDEYMRLFLATDLTAGDPAREPGEQIENLVVSLDDAVEMIRCGEIEDAKTIVGLLMYKTLFQLPNTRTGN